MKKVPDQTTTGLYRGLDLDQYPDLPAVINHPLYKKLELVSELFLRRQKPVKIDPREFSDETLIENIIQEALMYNNCLVELLHRVRKGVMPVTVIESLFSEQSIKDQLMINLNVLVDAGDLQIKKIDHAGMLECRALEDIIRDIIDTGLLTVDEIQIGIQNKELDRFFREKFVAAGQQRPTFIAQYYRSPTSEQSEVRERLERAHTYFDLSKITAESNMEDATRHAGLADEVDITFQGEEAPTRRRGNTLMSTAPVMPPAPEKADVLKARAFIPGMAAEVGIDGEETPMPLMIEEEIYTIGTDPINDYVVKSEENAGTEAIHGLIFTKGGKVFIKAAEAPLKLEKEHFEVDVDGVMHRREYAGTDMVFTNSEKEVEPDRMFHLMPKGRVSEDTVTFPCFTVKEWTLVDKQFLRDELRSRISRFLNVKAEKLFEVMRKGDATAAPSLLDAIAVAEKKIGRVNETARRYDVPLFAEGEYEVLVSDSFRPLALLINSAIEKHYKKIAAALLKHLKDLKDKMPLSLNGPVEGDLIWSNDQCAEARKNIEELFAFAASHGIPIMSKSRGANLYEQVIKTVEDRRLELLSIRHEEAQKQAQQSEETMRRMHEKQDRIKKIRDQYADIHLGENEVLDEETQFEYKGPAIRITDGHHFTRVDPLLLDEISIGDHPANTHRVPKRRTPKVRTADFMARIRKDKDGFRMNWLGGNLAFAGTGVMLSGPDIRLEPGRSFRLASYHVTVEERHAYTLSALKQICPSLAKELVEVVFNMKETSEGQDEEALRNLETLVEKGYVDEIFVQGIMAYGMQKLLARLGQWKSDLPFMGDAPDSDDEEAGISDSHMPVQGLVEALHAYIDKEMAKHTLQDAHWMRTMKMLAEISGKGRFLEKVGIGGHLAMLKNEAKRRAEAYCGIDDQKNRMMEKDQSSLSMRSIRGALSDKAKVENSKILDNLKTRSAAGAVQIARLHEMGLLDLDTDVAVLPDAAADYIIQIREIIGLRSLLRKLSEGEISVDEIPELLGKSVGKRLEGVLSADEIETSNHNIEVNLNARVSLEYFISKLFVSVGRKALRKAAAAEDPRSQVALIDGLMGKGLLKDTDLMQLTEMPVESVRATLEELRSNANYLDRKESMLLEHNESSRAEMLELGKIALDVDKVVGEAAKLRDLETLFDCSHQVCDGVLAQRMARLDIAVPTPTKVQTIPTFSRQKNQRKGVIPQPDRPWAEVCVRYFALAVELGKVEVQKILACDDSEYRMMILAEAVARGIFRYEDIGVAPEKMRADVAGVRALTKTRVIEANKTALREKYLSLVRPCEAELDDLDYMKQMKLYEITDPAERYIAEDVMMSLTERKRAQIKENIAQGEDVAYMRMLEQEINEALAEIYEKMPKTTDPLKSVRGVDKGKQSVY